jgi:hypothetical protein
MLPSLKRGATEQLWKSGVKNGREKSLLQSIFLFQAAFFFFLAPTAEAGRMFILDDREDAKGKK